MLVLSWCRCLHYWQMSDGRWQLHFFHGGILIANIGSIHLIDIFTYQHVLCSLLVSTSSWFCSPLLSLGRELLTPLFCWAWIPICIVTAVSLFCKIECMPKDGTWPMPCLLISYRQNCSIGYFCCCICSFVWYSWSCIVLWSVLHPHFLTVYGSRQQRGHIL